MLHSKNKRINATRQLIANDPDKSLIKEWARFKETQKTEELYRDKFQSHLEEKQRNTLPEAVKKFISTIKYSVRTSMRNKGGTPFSIIRQMFIYWDRDRTGKVNARDLTSCMLSLGVRAIRPEDINAVISHYNSKEGGNPSSPYMSYADLLRDVQDGEPTILESVDAVTDDTSEITQSRYQFENERYAVQPPLIKKFIEAIRLAVLKKMRREGGTPFSIMRALFLHYDLTYTCALSAPELIQAMRKGMGLVFTAEHAKEVLKFYNRNNSGEFGYQILLKDVTLNFPSMLDFSVSTDSYISNGSRDNPFIKLEFQLKDNKTIEAFRSRLLLALKKKMAARGGSERSLLRDAFTFWDSRCCGKLRTEREVSEAIRRLGITASADEVKLLVGRYDVDNDGEMNYNIFIDDMAKEEVSILSDGRDAFNPLISPTARSPANVSYCSHVFKSKAEGFALKTSGKLIPRDVLHGSFLRHDSGRRGHVAFDELKRVCEDLHIGLSDAKLQVLLSWFDSNGSSTMDYNEFVDQIYGRDTSIYAPSPASNKATAQHTFSDLLSQSYEGQPVDSVHPKKKLTRKLLKLKEDERRRHARLVQVKAEKSLIKSKLASIDMQRKALEELKPHLFFHHAVAHELK